MSKTPGTIALFPLFILGVCVGGGRCRDRRNGAGAERGDAGRGRGGAAAGGAQRGRAASVPVPVPVPVPGPGPGPGHAGLRPRAAGGRAPRLGGCQPRGLPRSELRARRAAGGPRGRAARGAGPEAFPEGPPRAATAPRAGAGRCRRAWHRSVPPGPAGPSRRALPRWGSWWASCGAVGAPGCQQQLWQGSQGAVPRGEGH